jgi:hypothetical protein
MLPLFQQTAVYKPTCTVAKSAVAILDFSKLESLQAIFSFEKKKKKNEIFRFSFVQLRFDLLRKCPISVILRRQCVQLSNHPGC